MSVMRRWIPMLALAAVGIASFGVWESRRLDDTGGAVQGPVAMHAAAQGAPPLPLSAPVNMVPPPRPPVGVGELVGKADGVLRFVLPAYGGGPDSAIELRPQAAVGVWLPDSKRLRIALLDHQPEYVEAAQTLDSVALSSGTGPSGQASAVVELHFIPTAQAFTPEEVESVQLVVTDRLGRSSTVDITGSVQWDGGLSAPEVSTAITQFRLQSTGSGASAGSTTSDQSWRFSVALPVSMRR